MSGCWRAIVNGPDLAPQKCIEKAYKPLWHAVFNTNLQNPSCGKFQGWQILGRCMAPSSHVVHAKLEDLRPQFC
jgi:hypothetical protein